MTCRHDVVQKLPQVDSIGVSGRASIGLLILEAIKNLGNLQQYSELKAYSGIQYDQTCLQTSSCIETIQNKLKIIRIFH